MPFPGTAPIQIAFNGGLQSKVAKFSLDQPNLEDAQNCTTTLDGQLQKRSGFTALSRNIQGGGVIARGAAIQTFGDELILFDRRRLYSWQDEDQVWIDKGSAFSIAADQIRVLNTKIATQSNPDAATAVGLTLYVWEDNRTSPTSANGVRYSIIDNDTGAFVVSDAVIWSAGSRCKVVPQQNTSRADTWLVTFEISATAIYSVTISSDRAYILPPVTPLATDGQAFTPGTQSIPYDVWCDGGRETYFAYASSNGVLVQSLGAHPWTSPVTTTTGIQCVATALAGSTVWVVWSDASATYARAFSPLGGPASSQVTVQGQPSANIALGVGPSGALACVCEVANPTGGNYLNAYFVSLNNAGTVTSTYQGQQRGLGLASKCFSFGGDVFVNAIWPSVLQATYFTLCLTSPVGAGFNPVTGLPGATSFEVVAKYGDGNGGGYRTNALVSECQPYVDDAFLFAGQRKGAFTSYDGSLGAVLGVAGYTSAFATPNEFNSVASNNNLHITGGVKKIYDSISVVEDNFHVFPELLSLPAGATFPAASGSGSSTNPVFAGQGCSVVLTSGGSLTANAQYEYCVTYEWTDNYGQVQRSTPSVPTVVTTTTGNLTAVLTIPTLRFTDKTSTRSPVSISVYRTQANLPIFYKVTNDNAPLVNDVTIDFVTFTDAQPDGPIPTAGISANESLYTGSQLPNTAPPSCDIISLFQNRLVINQGGDPNVVWYSQNKFDLSQYNTLPLDWNTSFVEGIDSRGGGGVTAIGLLDASLAIFKPTTVFLLSGSGPNPLDTSGEFNDAQLIVSDVGCTNQNSLVFVTQTPNSPGGLLFKSAKGIYLLGRDTSISYVGAPVEEYNGLTITSANLLARTNEIVFTTYEGIALVYNYFFNVWSTWTGLPAVDAVVWRNSLVILGAQGSAQVQDITGTTWQDTVLGPPAAPIQRAIGRVVRTPWIKLDGQLQGYQAVYSALILGQFQGESLLRVEVAYDYNPSIVETTIINSSLAGARWGGLPVWGNPAGTWADRQFSNYQFQVNFKNPRCQAIQLTLTDLTTPATAGSTLNGLSLEVLRLPGGMRMPTSNIVATSGYNK